MFRRNAVEIYGALAFIPAIVAAWLVADALKSEHTMSPWYFTLILPSLLFGALMVRADVVRERERGRHAR